MRSIKLLAVLMIAGCCACQSDPNSDEHEAIPMGDSRALNDDAAQLVVQVLHHEQMILPPTATVTVTMEGLPKRFARSILANPADPRWRSRGTVKTIIERTVRVEGGPPYTVALTYDPSGLSPEGRYTVRARIENAGQLLFANTGYTPAFGADGSRGVPPSQPIEVVVQRVVPADGQQP